MTKLGLLLSTDYDTLKNDGYTTTQITVPALAVITGSGQVTYVQDITMGQTDSILITKMRRQLEPTKWYVMSGVRLIEKTGSVSGNPNASYNIAVGVTHISGTTIRAIATVNNPYSTPLTMSATAEVIDFSIRSYLAPAFT